MYSNCHLTWNPLLKFSLHTGPGGRSGEVEDKLAKVGQKVDEVGQGVGDVVGQLAKTEVVGVPQNNSINSPQFPIKTSQLWCPVPAVGTRCPGGSIFHFYRCCGQLNNGKNDQKGPYESGANPN